MHKATQRENIAFTRTLIAQTYSRNIGFIRVIFFGNKEEQNSIPKLNPTEGCDSHVEEDSKQSRNGNHF